MNGVLDCVEWDEDLEYVEEEEVDLEVYEVVVVEVNIVDKLFGVECYEVYIIY